MYNRRWKPSKTQVKEFIDKMNDIDNFCQVNGITRSSSSDSYYFSIAGINYRVSNHTIESSNKRAYNREGIQVRELYHNFEHEIEVVYIHASKTRIIEIYNNLKAGLKLNGKGEII